MRQTCIFSGSSHPQLVEAICERLGSKPAQAELKKFSNGETSVEIKTSVRDQDVFVVQSGSSQINDNVMELLIMISACKGGSARSITAVMPYFPYSRQSKKKSHRGAITARMLANLMKVAGVNHVITIDLHASQMQGFFKCPVDNLFAEPLLGKWIRMNVPEWPDSVVVSKNPGGTKRVTSLADRLGLSFGIVTTDRSRPRTTPPSMFNSMIMESLGEDGTNDRRALEDEEAGSRFPSPDRHEPIPEAAPTREQDFAPQPTPGRLRAESSGSPARPGRPPRSVTSQPAVPLPILTRARLANGDARSSPLSQSSRPDSEVDSREQSTTRPSAALQRATTVLGIAQPQATDQDGYEEPANEDDTDELARDVITGRFIHGHIVDDDVPSPALSVTSTHAGTRRSSDEEDPMLQSFMSTTSSKWNGTNANGHVPQASAPGLGGSGDATASDDEEEEALQNPAIETRVTLVGNVRDKCVIIVDDMIDKPGSWIAAAETVVKRGQATKVYCMATHGLFGGDSLRQLDECNEIEAVIVTNAFPISEEQRIQAKKLIVLDVSGLLAEAIRRNHHGESISQLYHLMD